MSVFWEMDGLPVHCNVLCATREEALAVPRGDVRLAICRDCGFIYNVAFDPDRLRYDQAYENSLHFSPRFQEYAESLAARLVEKYDLRNKDVIEIACGKGDFLRLLCRMGGNRGVGFDPSYDPSADPEPGDERVTFVQDFYSERYAGYPADLICCRHALEHVSDPVSFLQEVRRNAAARGDTVVFFEVPNVQYTLRDLGIWDIIYEHCSYFCASSLARCFARAGFSVEAVGEEFGGQFLTIEARLAERRSPGISGDLADPSPILRDADSFSDRFKKKLAFCKEQFAGDPDAAGGTVVWGSGSKGVTFLNMTKEAVMIEYVVDLNPRKQGAYVPGTGQMIVGPRLVRDNQPDAIIVMNPIYMEEIRSMMDRMGVSVKLSAA